MITLELKGLEQVQKEINQLGKRLDKSNKDIVDDMAKVARNAAIRNAQPFGYSAKAGKVGRSAVKKDLFNCFRVVSNHQKGAIANLSEAETHHKSQRNSKGRVSRSALKKPIIISVFQQYLTKTQKRVGRGKASLAAKNPRVPFSRLPGFIKQHSPEGSIKVRERFGKVVWEVKTNLRYMSDNRIFGEKGAKRATRIVQRNVRKMYQKQLERESAKTNKKI